MTANEANQPRTFPLTAQKAGLVPALALTLHLLGKVDGFLAAAALVSSSERHPESKQDSPVFHPVYTLCLSAHVAIGSRGPHPSTQPPLYFKWISTSSLFYFLSFFL